MELRFVVKSNKLPGLPAAMRKAVGAGFAAAKGPLLSDMQRRTPVDTGELRNSETAESDETSLTLRASAPHAVYVHQGTRSMSARPFMRDAIEAGVPTVEQAITTAVESGLR
jgi:HK97 gp10 family phage protein